MYCARGCTDKLRPSSYPVMGHTLNLSLYIRRGDQRNRCNKSIAACCCPRLGAYRPQTHAHTLASSHKSQTVPLRIFILPAIQLLDPLVSRLQTWREQCVLRFFRFILHPPPVLPSLPNFLFFFFQQFFSFFVRISF